MRKNRNNKYNTDMEKEFYYIKEVALQVGVSYQTIARWIRVGKLKAHKIGYHSVLIHKSELERLLHEKN